MAAFPLFPLTSALPLSGNTDFANEFRDLTALFPIFPLFPIKIGYIARYLPRPCPALRAARLMRA